jgi:hypothetical protein
MYRTDEFVHLAIRRISKGNWVQLMCLKATADFYGWSAVFPSLIDAKLVDYPGNVFPMPTKLNGKNYRGRRLRICRKKEPHGGNPAGLTNCFRVSNNCSKRDLVAIAQAVKVDFGWMNAFYGERISREDWLAIDLPDSYCNFDLRAAHS